MRDSQAGKPIIVDGVTFDIDDNRGALLIYCSKGLRGKTITLSFHYVVDDMPRADYWYANVVERTVNDKQVLTAVFPALSPGHYQIDGTGWGTQTVTIYTNHIIEADFREND